MSDVAPDVEALAMAMSLANWQDERNAEADQPNWRFAASAVLDSLPDLLGADSPAGDALRERLDVRAEYLADLGPQGRGALEGPMSLTDAQEISVGPIQRRFVTSWEPTP